MPGYQARGPDEGSALKHHERELPSRGVGLVDLRLPDQQQEHPLAVLLRFDGEDLARFDAAAGDASSELPQLAFRERLEEAHPGKEPLQFPYRQILYHEADLASVRATSANQRGETGGVQ